MSDTGNMRRGFDGQLSNLITLLRNWGSPADAVSDFAGMPGDNAVLMQRMGLLPKNFARPPTSTEMLSNVEGVLGPGIRPRSDEMGYSGPQEIPGYAEGGRPEVGMPAMVGEQGPEMFVPDQPGTVLPAWLLNAIGHAPQQPSATSFLDPSLKPLFMQSAATQSLPLPPPPSWLQSGMTEAPPPAALPPTGGGLQGYEQYDPNTLAAMRMQRGAQGPSRSQAPMPQGMTGAETLDVVHKAALGDPDAKIPGTIAHTISDVLSRPPSTWSEEEQHIIYGATTQAALMATPSAMAKPISSIANTALDIAKAAPKTTAATAGTSALMLTGTEAGDKASDFRGRAAELQPEIEKVRGRIEALEGQRSTLAGKTVPDPSTRGNAEQKRAAIARASNQQTQLTNQIGAIDQSIGPLRSRLKELQDQQNGFQVEALAAEERGRPLVERYPWVKYGPVVGGIIAGATALDPRLRAVGQYNQLVNRMGNAVPGVEAAAVRGGTSVTNADRLALEQMRAYRDALTTKQKEITPSIGREFAEGGKAAVPGAFVGAELGMLPSQIDLVSQGKDTPAYQAAMERFTTLPGWLKTGLNAFVGSTGGSLGAMTPTSWYGRSPQFADLPRATAAEAAYLARLQGAPGRGTPGPAGSTPPSPPSASPPVPMLPAPSRRPIFNSVTNRWRDPITGNFTRGP